MGSLGSSKVNDILVKTMNSFKDKDYQILFITGNSGYDKISQNKFPSNVKVMPYLDDMTRILKNTDLIVTRAGASTLSEIIALNVPAILIPSPYVTNNHQYKNACDLTKHDAAIIIEEKDLSKKVLVDKIDELMNDKEKLKVMKENLNSLKIENSALKIYNVLKELVDQNAR